MARLNHKTWSGDQPYTAEDRGALFAAIEAEEDGLCEDDRMRPSEVPRSLSASAAVSSAVERSFAAGFAGHYSRMYRVTGTDCGYRLRLRVLSRRRVVAALKARGIRFMEQTTRRQTTVSQQEVEEMRRVALKWRASGAFDPTVLAAHPPSPARAPLPDLPPGDSVTWKWLGAVCGVTAAMAHIVAAGKRPNAACMGRLEAALAKYGHPKERHPKGTSAQYLKEHGRAEAAQRAPDMGRETPWRPHTAPTTSGIARLASRRGRPREERSQPPHLGAPGRDVRPVRRRAGQRRGAAGALRVARGAVRGGGDRMRGHDRRGAARAPRRSRRAGERSAASTEK